VQIPPGSQKKGGALQQSLSEVQEPPAGTQQTEPVPQVAPEQHCPGEQELPTCKQLTHVPRTPSQRFEQQVESETQLLPRGVQGGTLVEVVDEVLVDDEDELLVEVL
jgi:hypothetical protein